MSSKQKIHFILTGGTIDSYYEGAHDTVVPLKHSIIPDYIRGLKLQEKIKFSEVCMKDSRDITRADRALILRTVDNSSCNKVIITHGTYTIGQTLDYLQKNLKRNDQTIMLTGSMLPISGFAPSDGPFNLGYAIAKIEQLPAGIYVCMNANILLEKKIVVKKISKSKHTEFFGENK